MGAIIYYILHRKKIINNFKKEKEDIVKNKDQKIKPIIDLNNKKIEIFKDKTIIPKSFSLRKVVKNDEKIIKNEKKEEENKSEKNTNEIQKTITKNNINKDKSEEVKNKVVKKVTKKRKVIRKKRSSKKKKK